MLEQPSESLCRQYVYHIFSVPILSAKDALLGSQWHPACVAQSRGASCLCRQLSPINDAIQSIPNRCLESSVGAERGHAVTYTLNGLDVLFTCPASTRRKPDDRNLFAPCPSEKHWQWRRAQLPVAALRWLYQEER
jgi:hypothetical protein